MASSGVMLPFVLVDQAMQDRWMPGWRISTSTVPTAHYIKQHR